MSHYTNIKTLLSKGCGIFKEKHFKPGKKKPEIITYHIGSIQDERSRTIHYQIAFDIAKMLLKEGAKVIYKQDYFYNDRPGQRPEAVEKGCVRYNIS